jgi:hypothetical protein
MFKSDCLYNVRWFGVTQVDNVTDKSFERTLPDGSYVIACECYNEQGCGIDTTVTARCIQQTRLRVMRNFCKIKKKGHADQQIGGDTYRMKYKFKSKFEGASGLFNRALVVSRTKLKVKKCRKIFNKTVCYRRGFRADKITAGFEGTFRKKEKGTSGCRGDVSTQTTVDYDDEKVTRTNKKKVKKRSTGTYLVHRADFIKSVHEVMINGTPWKIELQKPVNSCSMQ